MLLMMLLMMPKGCSMHFNMFVETHQTHQTHHDVLGAALGSEVPRREKSMGVVAGFSGSMSGMGPRLPATMATVWKAMRCHDAMLRH